MYKRGLKVVFEKDLTLNVVFAIGRDERGEKGERDRGNEEGKKKLQQNSFVSSPFSHTLSLLFTYSHSLSLYLSYTKTPSHSYSSIYHAHAHTHTHTH